MSLANKISVFRKCRVLRVPATTDTGATEGIKEFKTPAFKGGRGFSCWTQM